MKNVILAVALFVSVFGFAHLCDAQPTVQNAQIDKTLRALRSLVENHPEPLVREQLKGWLATGKVKFAGASFVPEMVSSVEKYQGHQQAFLWYNLVFLQIGIPLMTPRDRDNYLKLVIYHEAVHLDDHISGRILIGPLVSNDSGHFEETVWDAEWSAVTKEWEFAKKLGVPYLVSDIYQATRAGGDNPRNFLEGFYHLQMAGNAIKVNPSLGRVFNDRYQKEVEKIHVSGAK